MVPYYIWDPKRDSNLENYPSQHPNTEKSKVDPDPQMTSRACRSLGLRVVEAQGLGFRGLGVFRV